jgi:hypothetical protein
VAGSPVMIASEDFCSANDDPKVSIVGISRISA